VDIVLASAGAAVSRQLAPEAIARGAVVIDNTSEFRLREAFIFYIYMAVNYFICIKIIKS
jgi:aspartate-semialdehyde dehydrogenase